MTQALAKALSRLTALPVTLAVALLLAPSVVSPASAQLSTVGAATQLLASVIRGSDSAFDPVNSRFLVIGAYGPVTGLFVDTAGNVSAPFTISTGGHANYARLAYSPHVNGGAGGFLVVWANEDGGLNNLNVHSRVISAAGVPLGSENIISDASRAWLESGPAVAYSPTSQRFLVSWATLPPVFIKARAVDLTGAALGNAVTLSTGYGRDPGVAWNPTRDEFGVSFSGEGATGGYSVLAILPAGNPEGFRRSTFNVLGGGVLTFITDLAYSPVAQRYIMTWYEAVKARVAEFDDDGTWIRTDLVTNRVGVYDSLSVSYNPITQTLLLVGLDPFTDRLTAAELDRYGQRIGNESTLAGGPAFYARASANTNAANWLALMSRTFKLTGVAVVSSTPPGTLAGAPTPPPPPTPPPTTTPPTPTPPAATGCPGGAIPGMTCVNGDWVPDTAPPTSGGGGGSTGGCPGGPIPGMTCVNGDWVATGGGGGSTGGGGGSACPGGTIPGMTCVNGDWVPNGSTGGGGGSTGGGGGSACPGGTIPGMTCVNGEWVPTGSTGGGGTGGGGGSACPGGTIPGMTCVNGEWVPGGSTPAGGTPSGGGGLGCPGSVPGMTCVNGEWVPGGSAPSGGTPPSTGGGTACPGTVPGMVCVNGEWVVGGVSLLPICTGGSPAPVAGWVRIGLTEWLPAEHPLANAATCRAN